MAIDQQIDAEYGALKKKHGESQLNKWFSWSQSVPEVKQKINSLVGRTSTTELYGIIENLYNQYNQKTAQPYQMSYIGKATATVAAIAMLGIYLL